MKEISANIEHDLPFIMKSIHTKCESNHLIFEKLLNRNQMQTDRQTLTSQLCLLGEV